MRVLLLAEVEALALKVLYCLHATGHRALLVSNRRMPAALSRYLTHAETVKFPSAKSEQPKFLNWLLGYISKHQIDAVVACDMPTSALLEQLKGNLQHVRLFPVSSAETLNLLHDKWRFAQLMMRHKISTPPTRLLASESDLQRLLSDPEAFPTVVKPLEAEGGSGVRVISDADALREHLASGARHCSLPLIAQRYIPGEDIDLSVLAVEGEIVAWTVQKWVNQGTLEFSRNDAMLDLGKRAIRAAGYSGVAHFDMRLHEHTGEAYLVECNPRFWMTLQVSLWHGVNFVDTGLESAGASYASAMEHYQVGQSLLAGEILRCVLRNPTRLLKITVANWRGFFQIASDPLPYLSRFLKQRSPG